MTPEHSIENPNTQRYLRDFTRCAEDREASALNSKEHSSLTKAALDVFRYKQVLVLRTDLKMSRGKTAIQVAHAAVSAAEQARKHHRLWWRRWLREGQKKVAVKVATLDELMNLREEAVKADFPTCTIQDRGLTEIPPGTITVLGIGPVPTALVDKITGDLPLL